MPKRPPVPWTDADREVLRKWYPHFGSTPVAQMLGRTGVSVRGYVQWLGLHMLPKSQRLCFSCRDNFQSTRNAGLFCISCHNSRRKEQRTGSAIPFASWLKTCLNSIRYRDPATSITIDYLQNLWANQSGCCYYSGEPLQPPTRYGGGRTLWSPSVERLDPSIGYHPGNVVWAAWICNRAKNNLTEWEFLDLCQKVTTHSLHRAPRLQQLPVAHGQPHHRV